MIEASLSGKDGSKQEFSSLGEISGYFQQRRDEIVSLNYDEGTKESFLAALNQQEDRVIREFMKP